MIQADGIAITFSREMIKQHGGLKTFLYAFRACLENDDIWMHFCKNKPQRDINFVYIIIYNRLAYKCYYGGTGEAGGKCYRANGSVQALKNHIALAGPLERCPFKRILKGFQGFRYTTELF